MTNLMGMSFGTFQFPQNPVKLQITLERSLKEAVLPFWGSSLQDLGKKRRKISGEGYFTGESCRQDFARLRALFEKGIPDCLRLPGQAPFLAAPESLTFTGMSGKDLLGYRFVFTEVKSGTHGFPRGTITAREGDSLWNLAQEWEVPVEELLAANPGLEDMGYLLEGEEVRLP